MHGRRPGWLCAGFGFDPTTFAPTYQLTYGAPGRSLALEIAARLGLNSTIIDAARQRRHSLEAQLADHLAKVDKDLQSINEERGQLQVEQERQACDRQQLAADRENIRDLETRSRERLRTGLDEQLQAARTKIDAVVQTLRKRVAELERRAADRVATGQTGISTGESGTLPGRRPCHSRCDSLACTRCKRHETPARL